MKAKNKSIGLKAKSKELASRPRVWGWVAFILTSIASYAYAPDLFLTTLLITANLFCQGWLFMYFMRKLLLRTDLSLFISRVLDGKGNEALASALVILGILILYGISFLALVIGIK